MIRKKTTRKSQTQNIKKMTNLAHDGIGMIHLISAITAMLFGTMVLLANKGTVYHKRIGYLYFASMVIMLVTSFMIYRLFGGFGIFHILAVVSTITLAGGMIPVITRRPKKNWLGFHFAFMYWSVIGLYAAFVSEVLTRVPSQPFFNMLGIAVFIVMLFGNIFWFKYKNKWMEIYS